MGVCEFGIEGAIIEVLFLLAEQGVEDDSRIDLRLGVWLRYGYRIFIMCFFFTPRMLSQNRPGTDSRDWSIL
jgi:hypothetical protein